MNLDNLELDIIGWGYQKGILPDPSAKAQWQKTLEEVYELADAIDRDDVDEARDAIGDIFVTLVMQCGAWNLTMNECVKQAYDTISKRTGQMVDGVFVKDE